MLKPATYLDYSQALCAQTDPELFFPDSGDSTRPAIAICNVCPVKSDCLLEALANDYNDGIWGGLSAKARQELRRSSGTLRGRGRRKGDTDVHKRSSK